MLFDEDHPLIRTFHRKTFKISLLVNALIILENDNEDESELVFRKVIENLEPPIQNKENEEEKKMKQD